MLLNHRRALVVAVCLLVGALLVGLLVALPLTKDGVQDVDDATRSAADAAELAPLVWLAKVLSVLGSTWVNWPVRVAAAVLLGVKRRWLQLAAFGLAVLSSEALIGSLKSTYDRSRPPDALIGTSGFSFPSGHAIATAVTAVGIVVVLLPPGPRRWAWEVRAVVFAFVMALSRVYLRAHWLSDVVAGGLLGAGLALGWPAVLQAFVRGSDPADPVVPSGSRP